MAEHQISTRRIVDKETSITHYSVYGFDQHGYELTKCELFFYATTWHLAWRSRPNDDVTCLLCLGAVDD